MASLKFRIAFILYPRLTQLNFTGPYEVLVRMPGAEAIVASKEGGTLPTEMGLAFANLQKLADVDTCDMIMVSGGPGQTKAMLDPDFMAQVKRLAEGARYVTSVCTGSLILAAAGLLRGKRAGSHWAYRDMLSLFGAIPDPARVVRDGNIITGGGVTAGIDIALTIAAEIAGEAAAKQIHGGRQGTDGCLCRGAPAGDGEAGGIGLMLQLRPNCENCDRDLPPESPDACICSFECTFCAPCAEGPFGGACPNCGGNFSKRPIRPAALLAKYPASTERVLRK